MNVHLQTIERIFDIAADHFGCERTLIRSRTRHRPYVYYAMMTRIVCREVIPGGKLGMSNTTLCRCIGLDHSSINTAQRSIQALCDVHDDEITRLMYGLRKAVKKGLGCRE